MTENGSENAGGIDGAQFGRSSSAKTRKKQTPLTKALGSLQRLATTFRDCGQQDQRKVGKKAWTHHRDLCMPLMEVMPCEDFEELMETRAANAKLAQSNPPSN